MSASASPAPGSVTTSDGPSLHLRLSEQLQALSLVGETLTLRLLELEERLSGLEAQLQGLIQSSGPGETGDTTDMLAATEERIARLEELLNEQPAAAATSSATVHTLEQRPLEEEAELNPFPEEEEQPFMDELSA
jgi:hypothetical protein